jgi:hypothetical protein
VATVRADRGRRGLLAREARSSARTSAGAVAGARGLSSSAVHAGTVYDLAHLDPVTIEKPQRPIRTWCRFTTHVFSRAPSDGEVGPFIMDEGRRPRLFCPECYALSLHLPTARGLLADPRRHVWQTAAERNWLHRAEVTLAINGATIPYQVFFAVKRRHGPRHMMSSVWWSRPTRSIPRDSRSCSARGSL